MSLALITFVLNGMVEFASDVPKELTLMPMVYVLKSVTIARLGMNLMDSA